MKSKLPFILTSALLLGAAVLPLHAADKVTMTTGLAVGEQLRLAVNADAIVKLTWGNGDEQTMESDGSLLTLEVKDASLTLTSEDLITSLYVQGNRLSALNVTAAPHLQSLFCADNSLEQLDLSKNTELEVLDAQGNALPTLSITNAKALDVVNVANNCLTKLTLAASARPTSVVCAGNQLTALPAATTLSCVNYLWTQDNAVKVLPIAQSKGLRGLNASDNQLTTINFAATPQLHDVWVSGNELTTLDLSKSSPQLQSLVADHNELTTVVWDKNSKRTMKYVALQHNAICLNSMPSLVFGGANLYVDASEQKPYELPQKVYEVNETVNINNLVAQNGWGVSTFAQVSVLNEAGEPLTADTDYMVKNNAFTFKSVLKGLHFSITSSAYAGYTFTTSVFNVGTTEGIAHVEANKPLTINAGKGCIQMTADCETDVTVVNTAGACVLRSHLVKGQHNLSIPAGVYVVNGHKVMVK